VIYTGWHYHQVVLLQLNSHPVIALAANIKEAATIQDVPNFLVLMQVFVEEHLHLLFIYVAHFRRGNGNLIPVLVVALRSQGVDILQIGIVEV
jgi:hypothetical protein